MTDYPIISEALDITALKAELEETVTQLETAEARAESAESSLRDLQEQLKIAQKETRFWQEKCASFESIADIRERRIETWKRLAELRLCLIHDIIRPTVTPDTATVEPEECHG